MTLRKGTVLTMQLTKYFFAACLLAATSWAQTATGPASITATGIAKVSITPDMARIDIGVYTQAATADEATSQNATQAVNVIAALHGVLGPNASIKTISYSVSPVYNNPALGQQPQIVGYAVTNIVEATITDLTKIGKAMDSAIQNGANRVQGIAFDLQDRNPAEAQALKTAAAAAKTQADAIASGLNIRTGAVLHAVEGVNTAVPIFGVSPAAAVTTPVETGVVVVQANVTLEVAISQ